MGMVSGLVNQPDQPAAEIVAEIVEKATQLLGSAAQHLTLPSKL